tara:strand:+ start:787 stop:1440 length:654 start_codon:yes stop_codon:yes gene_type:complete
MAIDPAMVGFNVVDNLQNTLLSYVMQNRKMQQQDRQFQAELGQRAKEAAALQARFDDQFGEGQRRFNITQGRLDKMDARAIEKEKAGADTFSQFYNVEKQKRDIDKYKRDRIEYLAKQKKDLTRTDLQNLGGFTRYGLMGAGRKGWEKRADDLLTKEFETKHGALPQLQIPEMQNYGFVPQYAPELLSMYQQYNPENVLNQARANSILQAYSSLQGG